MYGCHIFAYQFVYFTDEELISSVASLSVTDSCSVNEEVTPCVEPVIDGPRPPPPPPDHEYSNKHNIIKSNEDLLPPLRPTTTSEDLGSYTTHTTDHFHMQESYALHEIDSLKKENDVLKAENSKLKEIVRRLQEENVRLLNANTMLQGNHYETRTLMKTDSENGMPIPEQSGGATRQSEMVPKGSGAY